MIASFFFDIERLLLNHAKTPGFLAPGGEEFNPGPEMRLDRSELLCNKVLLKYKPQGADEMSPRPANRPGPSTPEVNRAGSLLPGRR